MDVKPQNKWVQHIKEYAAKHGMNYREAMRSPECKEAYKNPVPEVVPEPQVETKPKKSRKKIEIIVPPVSPVIQVPQIPTEELPAVVKKVRAKREPKMVVTNKPEPHFNKAF